MLLLFSVGEAELTTCLGKSCSFGLLCMCFVKVYQFCVCVFLSFFILRVGCGI